MERPNDEEIMEALHAMFSILMLAALSNMISDADGIDNINN